MSTLTAPQKIKIKAAANEWISRNLPIERKLIVHSTPKYKPINAWEALVIGPASYVLELERGVRCLASHISMRVVASGNRKIKGIQGDARDVVGMTLISGGRA